MTSHRAAVGVPDEMCTIAQQIRHVKGVHRVVSGMW
jgi:hypothetical protein